MMMNPQNGKSIRILLSPLDDHLASEKDRFIESIRKGFSDAEKGFLRSTKELKKRLLTRENSKNSL